MSGVDAIKGFDYQFNYSVLLLIKLVLDERFSSFLTIQFDGKEDSYEDINIQYENYTHYIQIKKIDEGYNWSLSNFYKVLKSFNKKDSIHASFSFITNGPANRDLINIKDSITRDGLEKCSEIEKLENMGMNRKQLISVLKKTDIKTLEYPTNSEENISKNIRKEINLLLTSSKIHLSNEIENVYRGLYSFVVENAVISKKIDKRKIVLLFQKMGIEILKENEWERIPQLLGYSERTTLKKEIEIALKENNCVILKGISGAGKTYTLAKCFEESRNKYKFWIDGESISNLDVFLKYYSNFLSDNQIYSDLYNEIREKSNISKIEMICNIISEKEIELYVDNVDLCEGQLKEFFKELIDKNRNTINRFIFSLKDSSSFYSNIKIIQGRIIEINVGNFTNEEVEKIFREEGFENLDLIKEIMQITSGYPIQINLIKELVKENIEYIDEFLVQIKLENENSVLDKYFEILNDRQKKLLKLLASCNDKIGIKEIEEYQQKINLRLTSGLIHFLNISIIQVNNGFYSLHDYYKKYIYENLSITDKLEIHGFYVNYYPDVLDIQQEEEYLRCIAEFGYHYEKLNANNGVIKKEIKQLLDLDENYIFALWGVKLVGYPFVFDEKINKKYLIENLTELKLIRKAKEREVEEYIFSRIEYILLCLSGINDVKNEDDQIEVIDQIIFPRYQPQFENIDFYIAKRLSKEEYDLLFYFVYFKYNCYSIGYVQKFKENSNYVQQMLMCEWEHCIEYYPLETERKDDSCPIFGHNCPGGNDQVNRCKQELIIKKSTT